MAADITTLGLAVDSSQVNRARDDLGRFTAAGEKAAGAGDKMESSWGKVKGLMAGIALGAGVMELVKMADAMTLVDARLKLVTGSAEDFKTAQQQVYDIAQRSNVGLEETAQLYTKLHDPVKRMGGTTKETGQIVQAFAASLRIGGASAQEAASATLQFAQAMGSGRLQGDEFRAIAEASPRFMKALADGMGKPIEQLKKMGSEGKLTADVVGNALMKSLDGLNKEMKSIPDTVGGAMTRLKNDFKVAVNEINKVSGTTLGLAGGIEEARKLIPAIKDEMVDAFASVGDWIERNKEGLGEVWDVIKDAVADVWDLAKSFASVVGFVIELGVKSGAFKTVWESVRLIVAGIKDGMEILTASFALMGAQVLKVIGIFSDSAKQAAKEAEDAALGVFEKFKNGGSEVQKLSKEMENNAAKSKQMKEALEGAGMSASDNEREMARLSGRVKETSDNKVTLKTKTQEVSKEVQTARDRYADLTRQLQVHIREIDAEEEAGTKLNDAQKAMIKFKEELSGKYKDLDPKQRASIEALFKEWDAKLKNKDATDAMNKAMAESARENDKFREELDKTTLSIQSEVDKLRESNSMLGLSKEATAALEIAKLEEQATAKDRLATWAEESFLGDDLVQQYKDQAQGLRDLAKLKGERVHLEAAVEARDAWKQTSEEIGKSFTDSLFRAFESGKSFGEALMDGLKNLFKTTVLKLIIQPVQQGMSNMLGNMFGMGGGGGGGGGGGAGGFLNGLGNFAGMVGNGLSTVGGWLGQGSTVGGWLNSAGGFLKGGAGGGLAGSMGLFGQGFNVGQNLISQIGVGNTWNTISTAWANGGTSQALGMGAGALTSAVGGFMGGRALGQMVSGGYGLGGGSGNTAVNIGSAIGAIWGPIGSAIGGAIGGLVNRAFGRKAKEVTGQGVEGTVVGGDFSGQQFSNWKQKGGWFRSDKSGTDFTAMNDDLAKIFDQSAAAVYGQVENYAKVIGIPADSMKSVSHRMRIELTDDEKKNEEAINSAFGAYQDLLANSFADVLAPFQKSGEKLIDTMARLSIIQQFSEGLNEFGGIFSKVATLSIDAKTELMEFAGGMEAFLAKTAAFVDAYYTDAEKMGLNAKAVKEQLDALGITGNLSTRADFRALVESADVTTTEGRKLLDALLTIAPTFAQVGQYLEQQEGGMTLADLAAKAPETALLEAMIPQQEATTAAIDATTDAVNTTNDLLTNLIDNVVSGNGMLTNVMQAVLSAVQSGAMASAEANRILAGIEANGALNGSRPSYEYDLGVQP